MEISSLRSTLWHKESHKSERSHIWGLLIEVPLSGEIERQNFGISTMQAILGI